jgi:hypothetical protein
LRRSDSGESEEKISKEAGYTRRAVHDGIQRARREADFESAQREQLREALREHQLDLLGQVERIKQAVQVPALEMTLPSGVDFGLEDLEPPGRRRAGSDIPVTYPMPWNGSSPGEAQRPSSGLNAGEIEPLAVATRRGAGAGDIVVIDEGSPLWVALKQHIGSKDPLWRAVSDWKLALARELKARAAQNSAIRRLAEEQLGLPLRFGGGDEAHFYPNLVSLIRRSVTAGALGAPGPDFAEGDIRQDGRTLYYRHEYGLLEAVEPGDLPVKTIIEILESAKSLEETTMAVEARQTLERVVRRAHEHCTGYLLLHHIPGSCGLCKKMGGQ